MSTEHTNTPETNSVAKEVGRLAAKWKWKEIDAIEFVKLEQVEIDKLGAIERERNEGRETCQEIDKSHRILESEVKKLRARVAELETLINSEREQIKVDGLEITRLHSRVIKLEKALGKCLEVANTGLLNWRLAINETVHAALTSQPQAIDAAKGHQ